VKFKSKVLNPNKHGFT